MLRPLQGHSSVICGGIALCPYLLLLSPASFLVFLLALTALAVVLLDQRRELAPIAGFALVFAALAKPTALLPAAALVTWLAWSDRPTIVRCGFGAAVVVAGGGAVTTGAVSIGLLVVVAVVVVVVMVSAAGGSARRRS